MILFLDIDGVLTRGEWHKEAEAGPICPVKVGLLNIVLRETGANVVLTSARRYLILKGQMTLAGFEYLLRVHGFIKGKLIGITGEDSIPRGWDYDGNPASWPVTQDRGTQIQRWLDDHGESKSRYAVVDDLDLGISRAGHPLVLTNSKIGLTPENVQDLILLLRGDS